MKNFERAEPYFTHIPISHSAWWPSVQQLTKQMLDHLKYFLTYNCGYLVHSADSRLDI